VDRIATRNNKAINMCTSRNQPKCHINHFNAELNPTCHLLAILRAHHIIHVSRIRVNTAKQLLCPTGKYVPALGYTIHLNNPTAQLKVNLQGKKILHIL
jgi:hypothetical protein